MSIISKINSKLVGKYKNISLDEDSVSFSEYLENKSINKDIALVDVDFKYANEPVLENIDLNLNKGEVLAIIGPSGTGKTTLLRLLSLFHRVDKGEVKFNGKDVWSLSERERLIIRRKIGMVFQKPNLFNATVHQNVRYGLKIRKNWYERIQSFVFESLNGYEDPKVIEKLEIVGLEDLYKKSSKSLSGGEAQRVAFARALAYEPEFLLLDEPTSDLDPRNTAIIEEAIRKARSEGIGIAIATHDMNQAERVADRVAVLLNGQIVEIGNAEDVFNNPKNEKTEMFINGKLVY